MQDEGDYTMQDYVAVGYDSAGNVRAFTTGTFDVCQSSAKVFRRKEKGLRVYPVVKVMTREEWDKSLSLGGNG